MSAIGVSQRVVGMKVENFAVVEDGLSVVAFISVGITPVQVSQDIIRVQFDHPAKIGNCLGIFADLRIGRAAIQVSAGP